MGIFHPYSPFKVSFQFCQVQEKPRVLLNLMYSLAKIFQMVINGKVLLY